MIVNFINTTMFPIFFLVPANVVSGSRPVNTIELLSDGVIPMVFNLGGRGVVMIVSALPVVAETVGVFHAKVKCL